MDVRERYLSFLLLCQLLDDVCERMRDKKVCFLNHKDFVDMMCFDQLSSV